MKIDKALILCAGYGKRLSPITLETPKPLLKINNHTLLENCINLIIRLGIKKIMISTFHLSNQIHEFVKNKDFKIDIQIINDGDKILDTGGGILNMINNSKEENFLIFNPDTLWDNRYVNEIKSMIDFYFLKKSENILMLVSKNLSYDKKLVGDFSLKNNLINNQTNKNLIYTGCQIINKKVFNDETLSTFSILRIWKKLIKNKKLNGYESKLKFFHVTDLNTFKKLQDH